MDGIQNKSVMVTGGATGIGYKISEILLRHGAKGIAIIDLPTSNGKNAVATLEKEFGKGRAVFLPYDVTKDDDMEKAFKEVINTFQGLDILINNAGILHESNWKQTIDVNTTAVIRNSFLALDYMGKHKGGKGGVIANMASLLGLFTIQATPVYCASKHAVVGFSQALAKSYNTIGVRVVVLCPGATKTALMENSKFFDFEDEAIMQLTENSMQSVDNVAFAMLHLIEKGKNGAVWVSENDQPPYAVEFPNYSELAVSVQL